MTQATGRLQDYPGLVTWQSVRGDSGTGISSCAETFVLRTCRALQNADAHLVASSAEALVDLVTDADNPFTEFLNARTIFDSCEVDLLQLLGDISEIAVKGSRGSLYQQALGLAADRTSISALRFLSAWIALNTGSLELCVAECEKIEEPESSVHTMHGQALLELGRAKEATGVLSTAVKIAPRELLAWFQLAKAYYVLEQDKAAWGALLTCQKLAPTSEEIAVFMAMVALRTEESIKADVAFASLDEHRAAHRDNPIIVLNLLQLALMRRDHDDADRVVQTADWESIRFQPEFVREIGSILRRIERNGWMDIGRDLLVRVTPGDAA